jgi:hypothetical protein
LLRREESGGLASDAAVEQARERTEQVKTWVALSKGSSASTYAQWWEEEAWRDALEAEWPDPSRAL